MADRTSPPKECCMPDFIYGGPFVPLPKEEPFMNTATPINIQLQGTFRQSFAYYSLKERLPIILTKVIDAASKKGDKILVENVAKLKSNLITNKEYDLFLKSSPESDKWNSWIENCENKKYFNNIWVFSECYVYRKLREACEISHGSVGPNVWDPFQDQKDQSFATSLEPMCIAAERVKDMLPKSPQDKRKQDFMLLLKLCLWANKCDMSLSLGEDVSIAGATGAALIDPIQMVLDSKDKVLVDDSGKAADGICNKADKIRDAIANLAARPIPSEPPAEEVGGEVEPPKIPCPAKMVLPNCVLFDIICDNSGYELFADLCLGHFLIAQQIVDKVRFHVKNMPWFVSDVTVRDFNYVLDACANADFNKTVELPPKPEGEATQAASRSVTAEALRSLAKQWKTYLEDGTFVLCDEPYWTWPHCYKDMKKYDYHLYRKLQYAAGIVFKGDLNYRKLLGERNWNPYLGFEPCLEGFLPAPLVAVRTVKADLICGLPKGKFDVLNKLDPKWMEKGDYGVIQYCNKAEPLKVSDRPCLDYGEECFGSPCPVHKDM